MSAAYQCLGRKLWAAAPPGGLEPTAARAAGTTRLRDGSPAKVGQEASSAGAFSTSACAAACRVSPRSPSRPARRPLGFRVQRPIFLQFSQCLPVLAAKSRARIVRAEPGRRPPVDREQQEQLRRRSLGLRYGQGQHPPPALGLLEVAFLESQVAEQIEGAMVERLFQATGPNSLRGRSRNFFAEQGVQTPCSVECRDNSYVDAPSMAQLLSTAQAPPTAWMRSQSFLASRPVWAGRRTR